MTDAQIVFLISQPRSGSTLLQAILGGHPDIHTCSEPWIALPFVYARKKSGAEFEFNGGWSKGAINAFFDEGAIDEDSYNSTLNSFLKALYQKALSTSGKKIFLDKTPRYYEIASDLISIFPDAKFIVLYRNPLSVLSSIMDTWVRDDISLLYHHSRDLFVAPKKLIEFSKINKENICLVSYEALVSSPELEFKRICEYLGVVYIEDIIDYNSDAKWVYGDTKYKDKKKPDVKSIDSWKSRLTNKRCLNFSYYYLRDLGEEVVNSLGYDFNSALSYIEKSNPSESDYKTWKSLVHCNHIVSIEEQRMQVRKKLQGNFFKTLYRKILP